MRILNSFNVPLPPAEAFDVLLDVPKMAPCFPGVKLLGGDGSTYDGEVSVKLGPVLLSFRGKAELIASDPKQRTARFRAQGKDAKGRGGATADVSMSIVETGGESRVDVVTDLTLSGIVAQYGRGTGLIEDVSAHLLGEFVNNLRALLAGRQGEERERTKDATSEDMLPASDRRPSGAISAWQIMRALFAAVVRRSFARQSRP